MLFPYIGENYIRSRSIDSRQIHLTLRHEKAYYAPFGLLHFYCIFSFKIAFSTFGRISRFSRIDQTLFQMKSAS